MFTKNISEMNANLQAAVDDCKKLSSIVYAESVGKFNEDNDFEGKPIPRDFVFSEAFVAYYEKKKVKKQKYYTRELMDASFSDKDNKVSLEFAHGEYAEQMVFETHQPDEAKAKIGNFLGRFFTNNDKIKMNFNGFNVDVVNTSYSVISRYIASSIFRNISKDTRQKGLDFLLNILRNRPENISIPGESTFSNILYDIIYALQAYPYGKSLTLNYIDGYDIYSHLSSFADDFNFEHIAIVSPFTANTAKFLKKAGSEQTFKTSNITFCFTQLDASSAESIKEFVVNKRSTTLSLINAFQDSAISTIYTTMLTSDTLQGIQYLSLDQTPNLELNSFISQISTIQVLSLEGCQLDVNASLTKIFNFNMPYLRCINLGSNACNSKISDGLTFPSNLTRLDVTYVSWAPGTIQSLFKAIANTKFNKKFSLYSCANQAVQTSDTNEALNYLTKSKSLQINGFGWADNASSNELFAFLKAKKPRILDISRLSDEDSCISQIPAVLAANHSIVEFTFQGVTSGDSSLAQIIKSISSDKLRLIDVSRPSNNTEVMQSIKDLISRNPQLSDIGIDGCSIDDLNTVIEAAKASGRPIRIAYPLGTLSEAEAEQIRETVQKINEAEQHRVRPDPSDLLSQPFDGPSLRQRTRFPKYMSETMREEAEGAPLDSDSDSDSETSDSESSSEKPPKKSSNRRGNIKPPTKSDSDSEDSDSDSDGFQPKKKPFDSGSDSESESESEPRTPKKPSKNTPREPDSYSSDDNPKRKPIPSDSSSESDTGKFQPRRTSKRQRVDSDSDEPPKKPSRKAPKDSGSDSDSDGFQPKKSAKKLSSDSDSEEEPPKKSLKKPQPPESDSDGFRPKRKPIDSDSSSEEPKRPARRPPTSDSDSDSFEEPPRKPLKRPPPDSDSDSYNEAPKKKPTPAKRPPPSDSDSDTDSHEAPRKKPTPAKKPTRRPPPSDSESDSYEAPKKRSAKKPIRKPPSDSDSDSESFGRSPRRQRGRPEPDSYSGEAHRKPERGSDARRPPDPVWEVPEAVRSPYDPSARIERLQRRFALAKLVEQTKK